MSQEHRYLLREFLYFFYCLLDLSKKDVLHFILTFMGVAQIVLFKMESQSHTKQLSTLKKMESGIFN